MVMTKFFVCAAALSAPLVAGHGYMGLPKVSFPNGGDITSPVTTISASQFTAPSGMSFTTDPTSNTKAFTAWIKTSEYKSLRDLILKKSTAGQCGNSKVADPQPLPDAVEWTHSANEGFTASHEGPCEVWCDDEMVFHDDNCAKNFPSAPAKLPYEKAKCVGKKQLATYWLALHSPDWQVYIGCAAIAGGSSGGSASSGGNAGSAGSNASPTPSSATPSVKPSAPSAPSTPAATPAPAAGSDADCDEDLPEPDCDDEYPEPADDAAAGEADADCDEDLPEPECDDDLPEPDCDDEYPEPTEKRSYDQDETSTSNIGFGTIDNAGGEDSPGKVYPNEY